MNGTNTGSCTYFFRPKKEVRKKMFELCGREEDLHKYRSALSLGDYEAFFTGRASGDFLDDATYKAWIGDLDEADCPDPEEEDTDVVGVRLTPIYQAVACTFVRALRDVVSDLGNPLHTLLRGMESEICVENASDITDQVRKLNHDISSLDEIKALAHDIEGALKKTVGHTYGPNVDITSSLPGSMERLKVAGPIRVQIFARRFSVWVRRLRLIFCAHIIPSEGTKQERGIMFRCYCLHEMFLAGNGM